MGLGVAPIIRGELPVCSFEKNVKRVEDVTGAPREEWLGNRTRKNLIYSMLLNYLFWNEGRSISWTAEKFGVNPSTINYWDKQFNKRLSEVDEEAPAPQWLIWLKALSL